jgi:Tetratricopeptide repeat
MYRQVLESKEKVLGKEHPKALKSMDDLASVLDIQGKHEAAEEIKKRIQEIQEKEGQIKTDEASA